MEQLRLYVEEYARRVAAAEGQDAHLKGMNATLKVLSGYAMEFCAREASQILGGASFTRSRDGIENAGTVVERIYREVRVMNIGGGSNEVMIDLAMKAARL